MMKKNLTSIIVLGLLLLVVINPLEVKGQESTSKNTATGSDNSALPSIHALKIETDESITLDGFLNESIWKRASAATGFTQRTPNDGSPATEKTEAYVIYTSDAIYVGAKAYDTFPDSIAATLFRKDGSAYSDWFYVNIDSYNDDRTSFNFAVNPKGVRKDILIYNDNSEDIRWDAVWEAKTQITDEGWIVEMKIPLSQLRFNARESVQNWGINFQRRIARKEEISFWSPTPQEASGFVSRYGELNGVQDIERPGRLEILPYASSSLTRAPGLSSNPYYSANDFTGSVGADIKYGITSDFTLTATVNPDFGQVEADPAVINLSANQTFFAEQRPFFLEGTDIFQFGRTESYNSFGNPLVFYSRRIGRAPQGNISNAGVNAQFSDRPDQTTIASAAKVSGKTNNGFSLGVLNAFTLQEKADYTTQGNQEGSISIEPPTNYFVGRVKQDLNDGKTIIGGYGSAVNRFIDADYLKNSIHKDAYIAGADFEHSWNDRDWIVSGVVSGSSVSGSKQSLLRTQQSPARYYNRVDADYLSVDPNRTSLNGYAGELSLAKYGGDLRGSVTYSVVSPGYEVNDIGFENRADYHAIATGLLYRETDPKHFRFYEVWSFNTFAWNYGGDMIGNYYNAGGYMQFNNLWSFNANVNFAGDIYLDRLTRGGPVAKRAKDWNFNFNINSNQTKTVSFNVGAYNRWDEASEYDHNVWAGISIRPSTNIQINVSPSFTVQKDVDQFVTSVADPLATQTFDTRYVFANIDQTTLSSSIRVDWTFTPDMSLQLYTRPFITSGNFYSYKEFTTPREFEFAVYGKDRGTISENNGTYTVDPDGNGPASEFDFGERDFNFRSIQANAVFRWEYTPGATLFLVWQQDRRASQQVGDFRFQRDFSGLFDTQSTNVFLIKLSYWFGT